MNANVFVAVASRVVEIAVDLGWTPPGWRQPGQASAWPSVLDHVDEVARAAPFIDAQRGQSMTRH